MRRQHCREPTSVARHHRDMMLRRYQPSAPPPRITTVSPDKKNHAVSNGRSLQCNSSFQIHRTRDTKPRVACTNCADLQTMLHTVSFFGSQERHQTHPIYLRSVIAHKASNIVTITEVPIVQSNERDVHTRSPTARRVQKDRSPPRPTQLQHRKQADQPFQI